jgi:enoyl-CoA hydratase / long-chain 3-hydroxyacyl-CoA dehydrogenase
MQYNMSVDQLNETEIQERISCRFVNEAALCLQDGVISSPTDGDIGAVFGIGFPPFRGKAASLISHIPQFTHIFHIFHIFHLCHLLGGPFRMVDNWENGARGYVDMMNGYADKYGEQFAPAQILVDHANAGTKFHP